VELLADLTLILVAALAGGFVAHRLRQPLMVGYILAGVAVGPFTGGFTVVHVEGIEQLAEIGVALLLFSLGLEMSFRGLATVRAVAVGGGIAQIAIAIALGAAFAEALGWTGPAAVWFGALVALSSTMVALKTLQAQGRVGTLSSRVMLGILVVQDLAVVPLIIILPELSRPGGSLLHVAGATLRAFGLLAVIVVVATRVIPWLMGTVARWNSRELFLLSTTAVALGVGYAAWRFGLSAALGAFIAGLVISESDYAHQALSDVIPLRDLFGMLFFVSVGMLLDPAFAWHHVGTLALVVLAVAAGKALVLGAVVRLFGYRRIVPIAVGLTLFQVGEFAFVLAGVGRASGAIGADLYVLVLDAAVVTMALTPIVSGAAPWLYERFGGGTAREPLQTANLPAEGPRDHLVVAGAGRVGRTLGQALTRFGLPVVLIEIDDRRARDARAAGLPVVYGDASHPIVLDAAGIGRARALLVTAPTFSEVRAIVTAARGLHPGIAVSARADGPETIGALRALGIDDVTSPELEAALEMTRQALDDLHVPADQILDVTTAARDAFLSGA
jgi:CPA2 family monovalent cation:H+ antiporter-2